jgi:hypothetical protein
MTRRSLCLGAALARLFGGRHPDCDACAAAASPFSFAISAISCLKWSERALPFSQPGGAYSRFEVAVVSPVIRIKAANRTLPIAA